MSFQRPSAFGANPGSIQTVSVPTERILGRSPVINAVLVSTSLWPPSTDSKYNIPKGLLVGLNSNTGKWEPIRGTQISGTEAHEQTVLSVDYGDRFVVGDNVKSCLAADMVTYGYDYGAVNHGAVTAVGSETTTGETEAGATTITVTTHVPEAGLADGDYIYVAAATDYDAHVAVGILLNSVRMLSANDAVMDQQVQILTRWAPDILEAATGAFQGFLDADLYETYLNLTGKSRAEMEELFGIDCFIDD
jgi:hypothetical protein